MLKSFVLLFLSFSLQAHVYTPQAALADLGSEKLTFVGREYPNADLGAGGNYVCIYKNSRVYVRHEGCRPNHTMPLAVFAAKIISRTGGLVELYLEHRRENTYRIADAGPNYEGTWQITSLMTEPLSGEPSFKEIIQLERNVWPRVQDHCQITKSIVYPDREPTTVCRGSAFDEAGDLERFWSEPLSLGLSEAHDLILKAPRR